MTFKRRSGSRQNDRLGWFIVRDHNGQALADVYFEDEPGRRSAAKLLSKDEALLSLFNATLESG
jgi:hypothetical protein